MHLECLVAPESLIKNSFILSLAKMDSRIKIYDYAFKLDDNFVYIPTKEFLYFAAITPTFEHQIAHMVEMNDSKRWTLPDWGFPPITGFPNWKTKEGFFKSVVRETRVRAIQWHMYSQQEWITNPLKTLLDSSFWRRSIEKTFPYGRFVEQYPRSMFSSSLEGDDLYLKKNLLQIEEWLYHISYTTYMNWSLDRIRFEWIQRLDHIRHWMES